MHSVCYVRGIAEGVEVERIYHAGRTAETVLNRSLPYRIGYLEKRPGENWRISSEPLLLHRPSLPSVLEPKVEYHHGRWHMRFLSIPVGLADDDTSQFRIMYTSSNNGHDDWSEPEEWFGTADGFFDSVVAHDEHQALMVIARDSDLDGRGQGPPQGVWLSAAPEPLAPRSAWSDPVRVFAPEDTDHEWTGTDCVRSQPTGPTGITVASASSSPAHLVNELGTDSPPTHCVTGHRRRSRLRCTSPSAALTSTRPEARQGRSPSSTGR